MSDPTVYGIGNLHPDIARRFLDFEKTRADWMALSPVLCRVESMLVEAYGELGYWKTARMATFSCNWLSVYVKIRSFNDMADTLARLRALGFKRNGDMSKSSSGFQWEMRYTTPSGGEIKLTLNGEPFEATSEEASGARCKRVVVRYRTEQVPEYEVVCDPQEEEA